MLSRRVVTGSAPLASQTQAVILVAALALSPSFLALLAVELIIQVTLSFVHFLGRFLLRLLLTYSIETSFQSALLMAIYYIYWAYYRCPLFLWPSITLSGSTWTPT